MILFDKKKQRSQGHQSLSFFLFVSCCCCHFSFFVILYYSLSACLFVRPQPVFSFLELTSLFMYHDFDKITFVTMSNFQVFVQDTDAKAIDEFEFRLRPTCDFPGYQCHVSGASDVQKKIPERLRSEESECRNEASGDQLQISKVRGIKLDGGVDEKGVEKRMEGHKQQGKRDGNCEDEASGEPEISKVGLIKVDGDREKEEKVEEENDGFRTPTSLERKIPAIQRCPPAPRKPRSEPLIKRSRAHLTCCRVRIDVSDHLESLFQPVLSDRTRSIKKARKSEIE